MNTTKKPLLIILIGLLISSGVFFFSNNQTSKIETPRELATRESQTGIETDTLNRIQTHSESGTTWGMSPFGSGKPLEEEALTEKIGFQKPNTEWKSRDITLANGRTLHYVFGEGNPKEVGLTEEEKETYKNCNFEENLRILSCGPLGKETIGYVTPDVEKDILTLLSHPAWDKVLTECRVHFEAYEYPVYSENDINYARMLSGGVLDIEKMLYIDESTGRKVVDQSSLLNWFQNALTERREVFGKDILTLDNCITKNGGMELYRLMDSVHMKSFYPLGNYPDRLTHREKYIPWY